MPRGTYTTVDLKKIRFRRTFALLPGEICLPAGSASQYEASLGYCVGQAADVPCSRCIYGIGPFAQCVLVPGFFGGVCVGCHWAGCATLCSVNVKKHVWTAEDDAFHMTENMTISAKENIAMPTEMVRTEVISLHH